MTRGWIRVGVPDAAGSALSIIQSHNPTCPLTLIATKAPKTLLQLIWASECVCVCRGDEKASNDHGCVANHTCCEAITSASLSSCHLHYLCPTSPNPTPLPVASRLPSIIPTWLVRELGWHLVAHSPCLKHSSVSHPLFPVHWLVYGGWHWASSISCPISHFSLAEGCSLLSSGLPSTAQLPISSSFTPVFHTFFTSIWNLRTEFL